MPYDITYKWNLKYGTNEPIYKTETDSETQRSDLWLLRGRGGLGVWDQQMQTIIYKMDKQQGPTVQDRELYSISCDKDKQHGPTIQDRELYSVSYDKLQWKRI